MKLHPLSFSVLALLAGAVLRLASSVNAAPTSDSAADWYNQLNKIQTETPAHAVVSRALTNKSNSVTLDGNNLGAYVSTVATGSTVSVTGTAGTSLAADSIAATGSSTQFIVHSAWVAVLSSSSVTASPVVQLVSGTTAVSGTVALTGSSGYVTALPIASPLVLLTATNGAASLSLNLITGGTAAALNARVSAEFNFVQ